MKLASRVLETRDLIRTRVSKARVHVFVLPLARQNYHVEPRRNWVYKTQNLQNKNKSTVSNGSLQNLKVQTLTHSNTHSQRPLKLTHSLNHSFIKQIRSPVLKQIRCPLSRRQSLKQSQLIVTVRSPPCWRYSLFLLNTLSFLLLRFLCLSFSFSNFRFWNSTVT